MRLQIVKIITVRWGLTILILNKKVVMKKLKKEMTKKV